MIPMIQPPLIQESWLSVTQLNESVRHLLEEGLAFVRVEAEISDLRAPPSGHLYCSLIDGESRVRAVVWRTTRRRLPMEPRAGERVRITGRVAVYAPRGEYQIVIEGMTPAGSGSERQRLLLLHARLAAEGLFDPGRKRPLPLLPEIIGLVTSQEGAALQDIIRVLDDRYPNTHLLLSPTLVQGSQAPEQIALALDRLVQDGRAQVIICGRGGGSSEDLAAFNSEEVVRAIARSPIPVISAVGHEVDHTLADLAADVRAATPSAAAEQVIPEKRLIQAQLTTLYNRLIATFQRNRERENHRLQALNARLVHPTQTINQLRLRCDDLSERLFEAADTLPPPLRQSLDTLKRRLTNWTKSRYFSLHALRYRHDQQQLERYGNLFLQRKREKLQTLTRRLQAVSPQEVLQRGYAIIQDGQGRILTHAGVLKPGDTLRARLARGTVTATVTHTEE